MRRLRDQLVLTCITLLCAALCAAQRPGAPNVIQIYMPDGSQPSRPMRFLLVRDDGRMETVFTDSKGKYSMSTDMVSAMGYTVTVEGDRQTYDTTTASFRINRVTESSYLTVYLRPLAAKPVPRAQVLDASTLDASVPEGAKAAYNEGMDRIVKGQSEAGIESLKRAISLYPQYLSALNDLGVAYMRLDRLDEAADAFSRALKINSRFAYGRLNLGIALSRQGKHAEAAKVLESLYKENPVLPGVRTNYVDALYDAGRLGECGRVLREALEEVTLAESQKGGLHYKLGRVLSREGKLAEAIKELRRATDFEPTAYNAHLLLGGDLLQLKRLPEAERSLLRAYELGGSGAGHAQFMLGRLYFEQKKFDLALRAFEQYLQDVPEARNAAQIREVVAKLKSPLP